MFRKLFNAISLGERYITASFLYIGLTLLLLGVAHEDRIAYAQSSGGCTHEITVTDENGTRTETVPGCEDGLQCCGSSCISSDQICCEDATSGSSSSCTCCPPEGGGLSSVKCQQ